VAPDGSRGVPARRGCYTGPVAPPNPVRSPRSAFVLALVALTAVGGCDGCDRSALVPFKVDAGLAAPGDDDSAAGGDDDPAEAPPFRAAQGQALPPGTRRVAVEGAPLSAPGDARLRGLLAIDVTGDDARDALVVLARRDGAIDLGFAIRRAGGGFPPPERLTTLLPATPGCTIDGPGSDSGEDADEDETADGVTLETVHPRVAAVRVTRTCPADEGRDGDTGAQEQALALVVLDRRPRVGEVLSVTGAPVVLTAHGVPPEDGAGNTKTGSQAPGRPDAADHWAVALRVAGTDPALAPPVDLLYRLGPAGLARDPVEPEATLSRLADDALEALRQRGPEPALRLVERALELHRRVCRESGESVLRSESKASGVPCGASEAAAHAVAVAAAAHARGGNVLEALRLREALGGPGLAAKAFDRRLVEDALGALSGLDPGSVRQGPTLETIPRPSVHRSRLAFLDEERLLVRGERPRVWSFGTGDWVTPTPELDPRLASSVVTDPAGALAVGKIDQSCAGHRLHLFAASDIVAGVIAGRPRQRPPLTGEPHDGCRAGPAPESDGPAVDDDGGFEVLGWPPQGILAARGQVVHLVPLTVAGEPAGPPRPLAPDTPLPAPLVPGAVTADGRLRVLAQGDSLVVVHPGRPDRRPSLLTPPSRGGSGDGGGAPLTDPAVSPSGKRIAWIEGGRLHLWGAVPPGNTSGSGSDPDDGAGAPPGSPAPPPSAGGDDGEPSP